MKIISWNVNGIRAVVKKGFCERIQQENPDVLCLQETKAFVTQMPAEAKFALKNYEMVWHTGERPGYSGTAIFWRDFPGVVETTNLFENEPIFHGDGRMTMLEIGAKLVILNIYFPNGQDRADGTEMLSYKLEFYEKFRGFVAELVAAGKSVIACGDYNIAHTEIDIARPKENKNSIGFLPVERAELTKLAEAGFVDAFRAVQGDVEQKYTRWSYRSGARQRNVGRRLDYFWVSEDLVGKISGCEQLDGVEGSDHCPVKLEGDFL